MQSALGKSERTIVDQAAGTRSDTPLPLHRPQTNGADCLGTCLPYLFFLETIRVPHEFLTETTLVRNGVALFTPHS